MKVLIINPPGKENTPYLREGRCMHKTDVWTSVLPPISLALVGTMLKKEGFYTKVIDSAGEELELKDIEKIIKNEKFDLVFINTATPTIEYDLKIATISKSTNPSTITCAFGIHVSVLPEETLEINSDLDIIIRGEPELTALEICRCIAEGEPLEKIDGISYKRNGKILHNQDRKWIENLDILPIPDWSLLPYKRYILPIRFKPYFYVVTSRGCPYTCTFCNQHVYYGRNVRLRSPGKIIEEIKFLKKKFNINDFMFWADTFTIDRNHTLDLCRRIVDEKLNIYWTTTTRVDLVDEELLFAMKKAGCWLIVHGIESGSEKQLEKIGKKITHQAIIKTIHLEKKLGFKIIGHFIIGFPDENEGDILETINFALRLPIDFAQFYFATPFPGSELYDYCKKNNLLKSTVWTEFEQDKTVIKNITMDEEKMYSLRRTAYRKFYLRPEILFKNSVYFIKPAGLNYFLKYGWRFLRFLLT